MSFVKRLWKDRVSQYPNRRAIYDGSFSKSVTVSRDEGTITEAGDPFNAENMNDLEDRIEAGLAEKPDREEVEDMVTDFFPLGEASGDIASFNTGVILPLKSCVCEIKPTQSGSGDTSPSNIRSILGVSNLDIVDCGSVNLFDGLLEIGSINASGQNEANTSGKFWRSKNYIPVKPNLSIYCKIPKNYTAGNANITIFYYDSSKTFISSQGNIGNTSITLPSNCSYVRFYNYLATASVTAPIENSINYPSTDTAYHAYTGKTTPINLGRTVYGAIVNDDGTGFETWGIVNARVLSWTGAAYQSVYANISSLADILERYNVYCNIAEYVNATSGSGIDNKIFWGGSITPSTNNGNIIIKASDVTIDLPTWNNYISNHDVFICFKLKTPQAFTFDPVSIKTLFGANNIYHINNGNIDVIYHKALTAKNIYFDNSGTTLTATNVEDAIKEVLGRI